MSFSALSADPDTVVFGTILAAMAASTVAPAVGSQAAFLVVGLVVGYVTERGRSWWLNRTA
ncbi:hypothetical protein [Rhodococcus opacus]|uniref:Uncharacterized protein n=1 Tax=Rhodococcus opacus TaxID=37919 RepID=A0A2S8JB02_RHOOP|nr:hypothetical protein [Rhodococcus opacus]PQP24187.1 hypothetical protein C5613_15005 [Rhodococcus opacus]